VALPLLLVPIKCQRGGPYFFINFLQGVFIMRRMLMAVMAVAVAISFSAPAFAGEDKKEDKKGGYVLYGDDKKDEKKGGH